MIKMILKKKKNQEKTKIENQKRTKIMVDKIDPKVNKEDQFFLKKKENSANKWRKNGSKNKEVFSNPKNHRFKWWKKRKMIYRTCLLTEMIHKYIILIKRWYNLDKQNQIKMIQTQSSK